MKVNNKCKNTEDFLNALCNTKNRVTTNLKNFPSYFKIDNEWELKTMLPEEHLTHLLINGSLLINKNNKTIEIHSPALIIASPSTKIHYKSISGKGFSAYRFRFKVHDKQKYYSLPTDIYYKEDALDLLGVVQNITNESERLREKNLWKIRSYLIELVADIQEKKPTSKNKKLTRIQINHLREYFINHHNKWPTPNELAQQVQLSHDYFSRIFRNTLGISPKQWMTKERIKLASILLLESNLNISQIAETFGYANIYFFSQQFKKIIGQSPTNYLKKHITK
ncbi:MAG: hypothetical protein COA79_00160 [Planctomycetota bacterium]|nr:MAG: hypothetical protein COA79_00160 [Planctomycetota bacterium]